MLDVTLRVSLHLEGPLLTQANAPGSLGVDALMARDAQGIPYFPYSHLKGRLLEACEQLKAIAPEAWNFDYGSWFGASSGNREEPGMSFDPMRTRLSFSDFREVNPTQGRDELRVRVKIDPILGTAQEHMLAMVESAYAAGQLVCFAGEIRYLSATEDEAARVADRLERALHWVHGLGAERTIGFGKCVKVEVHRVDRTVSIPSPAAAGVDRLHFALTANEPFCVTESRVGADNLFVSSSVIPGGVLKGALASSWAQLLGKAGKPVGPGFDPNREELCEHFSALRFRHARPVPNTATRAGIVPPLSFVKVGTRKTGDGEEMGCFRDLAREERPQPNGDFALVFAPDWKGEDHAQIDRHFGQVKPGTELRVRTKIDRVKRRAASAQLFAYESIRPEGFRWCTTIDLDSVPEKDRAAVAAQLTGLLFLGVRGLGKTKAFFTASPQEAPVPPVFASQPSADGLYVVTLQSPCLLANSSELVGKRTPQDLHDAYQRAWHDLSGNCLDLVRYYALQSLQGGLYLYKRFQEGNGKPYTPYLLTDAGSVFVLRATDARKAAEHIGKWLSTGLPVPAWARQRFERGGQSGAHWSNQPFAPENGYGEIAVNLTLPEIKPAEQENAHV